MKQFKPSLIIQILFLIFSITLSYGQAFTCKADLKYSMQPGKNIQMYPSDFIDLSNVNDKEYTLEIKDQNNNVVVGNKINYSAQSKIYTASVTNISTQNVCWTEFSVLPANNAHPIANCKANLVASVAPFVVTLNPLTVNQMSINYVSLFLNKSTFDCDDLGENKVKLSAVGADNVISQCECVVDIQDKLAPIVVMKGNVSIVLNALVPYVLTADEVGTYSDNCDFTSVQIVPSQITCNSPNPTTVKLIVKDKAGNTVSASTQVSYTTTNINHAIACNDQIEIKVAPTSIITITPAMVLEGNYSCNTNFEVKLSHNGLNYPKPELNWDDAGKTILYSVTDKNTNNTCWGHLNVIKTDACNKPFVVCDTKCPETTAGDCSSGYTENDNLDWPCGFDMYVCDHNLIKKVSPENLFNFHGVALKNTKPQIVNFDCNTILMSYTDQTISINGINSLDTKIIRTWTVLDWLDAKTYTYVQVFRVFVKSLEICDTKPWNTPFGDCASGHTDTDAVEWPADITISFGTVSLVELRSNPAVHPNDVEPTLVENCSNNFEKTYSDQVTTIDNDTKKIIRTWSIYNWQTLQLATYIQTITVAIDGINQVCANTYYGEPIKDVNMGFGLTDQTGCTEITIPNGTNFAITPSKLGNAKEDVDIMDLVTIYEGILGIRELNPYQMVSADINNDGKVTASDLSELKKFIDGQITWPDNKVWKFIDKNYQISNTGVSTYTEYINTNDLIYNNKFIGIKIGDVNGSYSAEMDANSPVFTVIKADDIALNKGESYQTSLSSDRNQSLVAVKLEFDIKNKGITVQNVQSDVLSGFDAEKNVIISEDKIYISWAINLESTPQGISLRNNEDFIKFTYTSNKNSIISDVLVLNQEVTNQIKQSGDVDPADVNLFWDLKIVNGINDGAVSHLNVIPNPFSSNISVIGLNEDATYEMYNGAGIKIKSGIIPTDGQLEMTELQNGFYVVRIFENGKKPSLHKLIKLE